MTLSKTEITSDSSMLAKENLEHSWRIAKMMAESDMVPKSYKGKVQDVLLAMEFGRALGLAPLSAIQNIAVINAKPALYGDALIGVCSGHPDFEDIREEPLLAPDNSIDGYRCTVKRRGRSPVVHVFTIADAKKAGLWGKPGPWTQYSQRMLQMRARGFALRDCFADALGGIRMVEEIQDYPATKAQRNDSTKDELMNIIDGEVTE